MWNSGILADIFGDWQLGGIVSLRTGVPYSPRITVRTPGFLFSPARPNLLPGHSNNPVEGVTTGCDLGTDQEITPGIELGGQDPYFDPCAYSVPEPGTLGNAGRNTLIAPRVFNMDISLQKEFNLDARKRLQFRAEFFNLLNHTNFDPKTGRPPFIFTGKTGRRNPIASRITGTATTARQIQFVLRFSF